MIKKKICKQSKEDKKNTSNLVKFANEWFKIQNINTFIYKNSLYIDYGNFEFELSFNEQKYRALNYLESLKAEIEHQ